jgi:diaminopimelate decarboxylase
LTEIAERFGTPVYVLDEEHVRFRCGESSKAITPHQVTYAARTFWCRAMARWIGEQDMSLDVCSEGELVVAGTVGFPAERIRLHGNAKSPQDLITALDYGVGRIVLDSQGEVTQLAALADKRQTVLADVTPEVDAHLDRAATSGSEDQRLSIASAGLLSRIRSEPYLELTGLYCHLGPHVTSLDGVEATARRLVAFMAELGGLPELSLTGGHALPYRSGDGGLDVTAFAERITHAVEAECAARSILVPRLTIEAGRAIIGDAGVTLYRVLAVKHGTRMSVVLDGGMSDSPRPAPYADIKRVGPRSAASSEPMTVVGRYCETGEALFPDARLPGDIRPGDLLAVSCTGAYHHAMTSNYSHVTRAPVVAVRKGHARPIIRRETDEDLLRRDVG